MACAVYLRLADDSLEPSLSTPPRSIPVIGLTLWRSSTVLLVSMLAGSTLLQALASSAGPSMLYLEAIAIVATGLLAFFGLERRDVLQPALAALGALLAAFPVLFLQGPSESQGIGWQADVIVRCGLQALALAALVFSAPAVPLVWRQVLRPHGPRRDAVLSGLVTLLPPRAPHEDLHQRRHRRRHRYLRVD